MATDVILLRLGSTTMESAMVLEWLSAVGDTVEEGETIVILEADKVEVELPAPASGILIEAAEVGAEIDVGAVVGRIGTAEEAEAMRSSASGTGTGTEQVEDDPDVEGVHIGATPTDTEPETDARPAEAGRVRASPPARRLARDLGVDLATLAGSGPAGRIMSEDVRAARKSGTAPQHARVTDAVRGRIARRLSESARQVVPVTLHRKIDATSMAARVSQLKDAVDPGTRPPSFEDLVIAAVGHALGEHPGMNASWIDDALSPNPDVDVNFAVQTTAGLIAPLLRRPDLLDIEQIALERRRLTDRALAGELAPEDVEPGTFTVTNLGAFGVDLFTPTVSTPQIGVLGVGRTTESLVPRDRGFEIVTTMWLSLTFDHRGIDGAPAAAFLGTVGALLEAAGDL